MEKKSVFGLTENLAAALSYILGPISGIVVLVMERENKFVRFHALQSTLWFLMLMVVSWVFSFVANILSRIWIVGGIFGAFGALIGAALSIISIASAIYLIYKAYNNETCKLPIIGEVAWSQINK
ncbi:MAG: hypothetical protein FWE05_08265 [Defluviitaleaceae bacterium]|nr:hypothetical protein [Defluviitaleaceae bacterium]